jgi:hypothetical protein
MSGAMQAIDFIKNKKGLNSFQLKLIALFFMTVDNIASTDLLSSLGRS